MDSVSQLLLIEMMSFLLAVLSSCTIGLGDVYCWKDTATDI